MKKSIRHSSVFASFHLCPGCSLKRNKGRKGYCHLSGEGEGPKKDFWRREVQKTLGFAFKWILDLLDTYPSRLPFNSVFLFCFLSSCPLHTEYSTHHLTSSHVCGWLLLSAAQGNSGGQEVPLPKTLSLLLALELLSSVYLQIWPLCLFHRSSLEINLWLSKDLGSEFASSLSFVFKNRWISCNLCFFYPAVDAACQYLASFLWL